MTTSIITPESSSIEYFTSIDMRPSPPWVATLIHCQASQESFDAYATAEHYHGRDSDGDWSEGDASPRVRLASIPRGRYQLVVEVAADAAAQTGVLRHAARLQRVRPDLDVGDLGEP